MTNLLTKLNNLYENISKYMPKNRIDGVFVGDRRELLSKILYISKENWKIFIIGDIKENNLFYREKNRYCLNVQNKERKKVLNLLQHSYIEVLYIFNENYEPLILIDDFPEDITMDVALLDFM